MKFTVIIAIFLAISCSKSPSNNTAPKAELNQESELIDFGEISISVPASGIVPETSLDFASLDFKQSGTQDLIITNASTSSSLVISPEDFDSSLVAPFTITSNSCIGTIGARKKCIIKFQLSNSTSLAADQNLTSLVSIKGSAITLTGILKQDQTDYNAPVESIAVSPLILNFGEMKSGESKELSIIVKNNGAKPAQIPLTSILNVNSVISSNSCPASPATLANRRSCVVKIRYTAASDETLVEENLITIANYQIKQSVIVSTPSESEPEVLSIIPQTASVEISFAQPATQSGSIRFTNTGTIGLAAPVSAISSDSGITISSISCAGGLARSKVCDVNYVVSGPAGESTQTIKVQSGTLASQSFSLNLNIIPDTVPCSVADAQTNNVSVANSNSSIVGMKTGSNVSQCLLAQNACNQYYEIAVDAKSCSAVSCTSLTAQDLEILNYDLTNATISGGSYPNCTLSCNSELQQVALSGLSCEDKDVINASIDVTTPGQTYAGIGYMVSGNEITLNSALTENFTSALLFASETACQTYNSNNCHATVDVNCFAISPVNFTGNSVVYNGLVDNISTKLSAYYINGTKKSSCVSVDVFKNQPQAVVSLDKPLEITKHNHTAPTATAVSIAPVPSIKSIAATAPLVSSAALLTPTNSLLSVQDSIQETESIPSGMYIDGNVSTSAGYFNDCLSATFQVPLSCTYDQEPLAQSIDLYFDTFNLAEYKSDSNPLQLFLAPNYSVVIPYTEYKIQRISTFPVPSTTISTIGMTSIQTAGVNWVYFIGGINSSSSPNTKLMRTNGTQVEVLSNTVGNVSGTDGLLGYAMAKYKNKIYFRARNSSANSKIYEYDPSTNFIVQVSNMTATNDTFNGPIEFGNDLFFQGISTADNQNRLYRYDGTSFHKVTQLCSACNDINVSNQKLIGMVLKNSSGLDKELVVSLAATNNITKTYSILQTTPGSSSYALRSRTSLNGSNAEYRYSSLQSSVGGNNMYMSYSDNVVEAASSTRYKLYKAALNTAATGTTSMITSIQKISNLHSGFNETGAYGEAPYGFVEFNGSLYFNMNGGATSSDFHLYRLDATGNIKKISNQDTSGFGDTFYGGSTVINQDIYKGVVCGGELYWPLRNSNGYMKLFKVTNDKLVQVSNSNPGGSDNVMDLFCENNTNTLYFKARSDVNSLMYLYSLKKQVIQ